MFEVLNHHADEFGKSDFAAFVMRADAAESGLGKATENFGGEQTVLGEDVGGHDRVKLIVKEFLGEGGFIEANESGIFLGNDAFHAVRRDQVAIHQVEDDLLDTPGARNGRGKQIVAGKTADGVGQERSAACIGFNGVLNHRFTPFVERIITPRGEGHAIGGTRCPPVHR